MPYNKGITRAASNLSPLTRRGAVTVADRFALTRFHRFSRPLAALVLASLSTTVVYADPTAIAAAPKVPLAAPQEKRTLTLEDTQRVGFTGSLPRIVRWLKAGDAYLVYDQLPGGGAPQLVQVEARTGKQTAFYDAEKMEAALAKDPAIGADAAASLARRPNLDLSADESSALLDYKNDLWVYTFATGTLVRVTETPDDAEIDASLSPEGKQVAFVQKGDLYTVALSNLRKLRRLTKDGSDIILNGQLDWVYEEEVYGRGNTQGYRWSPNGKRIAFLKIDDKPVQPFSIVDQLPVQQTTEQWRYPKAGAPNPIVTLSTVASDASAAPLAVDVSKWTATDRLIVRFDWMPDSKQLTFQVQPRNAKFLDLNVAEAATGKIKTLFRESSPAWVEILDNPVWLSDGTFLWLSDKSGYRHLYHYRANGEAIAPVTSGNWDIRDVQGVDPTGKWVYFAGAEASAIADSIYRAPLAGGQLQRLTTASGNHSARFSPNFQLFVDTWSSATQPPQMRLHDGTTGKEVRAVDLNDRVKDQISRYNFALPEMLTVKTRDGFSMPARILKPTNFEPGKKYPVFMMVYGGPGTQTVRDQWSGSSWEQFLVQNGYIVWKCDNRSASGQGIVSQHPIYRRLGESELADVEDSINYLKTLSYVDGSRIGITGWSYGGFLTEYALTHSKLFKCGVAGAGVSDWHLYDSIYTERYMDTPQSNQAGYVATAPAQSARNLSGKLLVVHGLMDDNVHVQNTIQLVYELERAGQQFDLMLYPSTRSRHGIGDPYLSRHLRQREWAFIQENL